MLLSDLLYAAEKYVEYYLHYEAYISSGGHLDFQVRGALGCSA